MKNTLLPLVCLTVMFIASPAYTEDLKSSDPMQKSGPALVAKAGKIKVPFALKHPKLHRFGRALRKKTQLTANVLAPYFQILGGLFQTALYFKH